MVAVEAAVDFVNLIGMRNVETRMRALADRAKAGLAQLPNVDAERRAQVDQRLQDIAATVKPGIRVEALTGYGDSAEEIAKIAKDCQIGLIVMGLHASPLAGARMGSVTYRVLCLAHTLVLALPPQATEPAVA